MGVSQQTISNLLREMGKIQKTDRWVSHELNHWQMNILLTLCKRNSFLHRIISYRIVQGIKSRFILRTLSAKKSWVDPGAQSTSFWQKDYALVWFDHKVIFLHDTATSHPAKSV